MRSKSYKLLTLLTALILGFSQMWAADQEVTFGTAVGTKGYVYSSSTTADNTILSDKCVYYSSAKNTVSLSSSKIIAYRLSLVFHLSSSANVDAIMGKNKDKAVSYTLYSITATQYDFIKGMSGVSNDVATAYVALDSSDPMKTLFKDAGISANDASRQKLLSAVDVADVNTNLYSESGITTSTSAETTISICKSATGTDKAVLSAGYYVIYIDCGSSSGNTLDKLSFTAASSTPDTEAPTLSSSNPANSATDVAVDGTIVLTFSEAIASVDGTKFSLSGATIGTVAIDGTDAKKVNVPYSGAANSSTVTLSVAADAVADAAGNKSAALSDIAFTTVAAEIPACPSGITISGTTAYTEGETITLNAALTSGNGAITYTWYKGSIGAGNEVGTGATFTKANCVTGDAGDYFCVASKDACSDAESSAYAVSVDALVACAELVPAISGETIAADDAISLTTATGGSMKALTANLSYNANGLLFGSSSSTKAEVTLNHLMQVGTVITATIYNDNNDKNRGLNLLNSSGTSKATWTKTLIGDHVETYTVVAGDGLAGTNVFQLQRNNNAYLKSITVSNCGAELLDLSSVVDPAGKGTVTLSATKVASGATATATYSAIDGAYDFDEWVISGATIDNAKANPVTITMGSTDAVITLKLKAAAVKHTVTYYDGATELGTELVNEGSNPTATGIVAPKKVGYTFDGWSTSDGGAEVALSGITVNDDLPLYAVYTAVNCATLSGTIFSLAMDVAPAANCTIKSGSGYETEADLDQYATISGGIAMAKNSSTSNHLIITTTPTVKLAGGNGKVHIQFDCALKEGDKIKTTISSQNIAYTTTDSRSTTNYFTKGTDQELTITSGHALENATEIYLWAASSNGGELVSLQVIRPEKYTVTYSAGDGSVKSGESLPTQAATIAGGKFNLASGDVLEYAGHDFAGWLCDVDAATYNAGVEYTMTAAPTTFTAQWNVHVDTYTVLYKDGTTELGSETVNVGSAPVGIADPTKDCYEFAAWQLSGSDITISSVSGTADEEVTLTARWTPLYTAQGTEYNFVSTEDNIAAGTAPNQLSFTHNTAAAVAAGSRIDNVFFSAMSITFEKGETPASGDDFKGLKIKTSSATIKLLVENDSRVNVTMGNLSSGCNIAYTDLAGDAQEEALAKGANGKNVKGGTMITLTTQGGSTVTLKSLVVEAIPSLSDDATLSDLKVGGTTIDGFSSTVTEYFVEMPYGTAKADLPLVSVTVNEEHAVPVIEDAKDRPSDTRATIKVTAEDGITEKYYYVYFYNLPKYGVELIKATHTGASSASVTGYIGGSYFKNTQGDGKLGSPDHHFGVQLASGNFQAGDVVIVKASKLNGGNTATMYTDEGTTELSTGDFDVASKSYMFTLTAEVEKIYIYRKSSACNPNIESVAVYRYMDAFIEEFKIDEAVGVISGTDITVEVPASTDVTALTPTIKAWANGGATVTPTSAQDFTAPVVYTVNSAYPSEDAATNYTVTVIKATASTDATLASLTVNGQTVTLVPDQYTYDVELPHGTSAAPTVVATTNHPGAVATVDPCTITGATITVVPESGAGDQKVYTLNFTINPWAEVVIWDGSTMSAVETSPDATTGFAWAATGFGSIGSYTTTYGTKSYSKYLPSGGSAPGRYVALTVPAGYVAKFYIVVASHSDGSERGMFIGSNLVKDPDATSVLELSNNDRDEAVAGMSEIVGAGTYYINPNASIDFQEIRAYLRKGYVRDDYWMAPGELGTVCYPEGLVATGGDIYEMEGKNDIGKIVFATVLGNVMAPGVPYLFEAKSNRMVFFATDETPAIGPANEGHAMKGTFSEVTLTGDELTNVYYFKGHALWDCSDLTSTGLYVAANRAWVVLDDNVPTINTSNPAPGRRYITMDVQGKNTTTGVGELNASEAPVKMIIDGKMFILRGEKLYDATGRLVK